MSNERIQQTLEKLSTMINQKRGAIGNPRLVDILNDLNKITERLANGEGKQSITQIRRWVGMITDELDKKASDT